VVSRTVDLGDLLVRTVRRGVAAGEYAATLVDVQTDDTAVPVETDPRRLERVISNLVRNSVQHGAPPVEVRQSGHTVTVRDHGLGFDQDLLAEGPQRFRRTPAATGPANGLGLVIATGQSSLVGVRLHLANAADGGARVTLEVPDRAPSAPASRSRDRDRTDHRA
jgi:signal transduction histidine kinase